VRDARAVVAELRKYDERLYRKARWLVLNKIDLIAPEQRDPMVKEFRRRLRLRAPVFAISAATGEGCRELAAEIARFLHQSRAAAGQPPRSLEPEPAPVGKGLA
jgi:GTP-binding protein